MRINFCFVLVLVTFLKLTCAATTYELEAKKFIDDASERYYKLYNKIADEVYSSDDNEDINDVFSKIDTVREIAKELVTISQQAREFDVNRIPDAKIKEALNNLRLVADLFVLGDDYFSEVLINIAALKSLADDDDIEPYLNGANMPNQDGSTIAYYPDVLNVFQTSKDAEELKYYWQTWRDKNVVWSSVNFYTIVEAMQAAAKEMDISALEFWYRFYNNKNFIDEMERVMQQIKPYYKQIHAFVRQQLYKKYGNDVIEANGPIPDHLYQQVLDQAWKESSVIEEYFPFKKLPPNDGFVKDFDARSLIDEAEKFYQSLGFADLDASFLHDRLKPEDEELSAKNCRPEIFDVTPKVYMKYCPNVDFRRFLQNHGYLARVHYALEKKNLPGYYFNSYGLEYPVGEAVILSASTPKHLASIGLAKDFQFTDETLLNRLFRMGIHTIFNIPLYFVHNKVMNDLLNNTITMEGVNKYYWKLMEEYAGVEPPIDREEGAIDFPYKFYLEMEDNHQTGKFVSEVLGYQFYKAFCQKSGQVGQLHNCDFYGNLAVGNDLKAMMALGSSKPWSEVISNVLKTDTKLNADSLLEYYAPIWDWIKAKNKETGVKIGWNATKRKIL